MLDTADDLSSNEWNDVILHSIYAAQKVLPCSKYNTFAKPYWTAAVKRAHTESRRLRAQWITEGRHRGHQFRSYHAYKVAKASFRQIQRAKAKKYISAAIDEINQAAETDYRLFWKLLRKRKTMPNQSCTELHVKDVKYTENDIVSGFKTHFDDVFHIQNDLDDLFKRNIESLFVRTQARWCFCPRTNVAYS